MSGAEAVGSNSAGSPAGDSKDRASSSSGVKLKVGEERRERGRGAEEGKLNSLDLFSAAGEFRSNSISLAGLSIAVDK